MVEVTVEQAFRAGPEEVFAFVANAENNPRWQDGMESCRWEDDEGIRVGAFYRQEARFLGRPIVSRFVVTEYAPPRRIAIETVESTFPIRVTRTVCPAPDGDGSVATAVVSGEPRGALRLLGPLMRPMLARAVRRDWSRLARVLDAP